MFKIINGDYSYHFSQWIISDSDDPLILESVQGNSTHSIALIKFSKTENVVMLYMQNNPQKSIASPRFPSSRLLEFTGFYSIDRQALYLPAPALADFLKPFPCISRQKLQTEVKKALLKTVLKSMSFRIDINSIKTPEIRSKAYKAGWNSALIHKKPEFASELIASMKDLSENQIISCLTNPTQFFRMTTQRLCDVYKDVLSRDYIFYVQQTMLYQSLQNDPQFEKTRKLYYELLDLKELLHAETVSIRIRFDDQPEIIFKGLMYIDILLQESMLGTWNSSCFFTKSSQIEYNTLFNHPFTLDNITEVHYKKRTLYDISA